MSIVEKFEKTKKAMNKGNEKVYIGRTHRFIIQQKIGMGKVLDAIRKHYKVKTMRGDGEKIILIEEKED